MEVELSYLALVRAALERGGPVIPVRAVIREKVRLRDGSDRQTPLAFEFRREPERSPSRLRMDVRTGQLFLRSCTTGSAERSEGHEYDSGYPAYGWNSEVTRRAEAVSAAGLGHGLVYQLRDLHSVREDDVERERRGAVAAMDGWFVCDKALWKAVPEPLFHVYRTNEGWKTALSFDHSGSRAGSARVGSDRRHFHFALSQYEEMVEWKDRLCEMTGRRGTVDEFRAHQVYEPRLDGYHFDLRFALDDIAYRYRRFVEFPGGGGTAADLFSLPMPVFDVLAEVRRLHAVPIGDYDEAICGQIAELIGRIEDVVAEFPEFAPVFAKPTENRLQVEKWNARPISLLTAPVLPAPR